MFIIQQSIQTEFEVKKSKFISHLVSYDSFDNRLNELKALHPKARHFVTASRYVNAFDQVVESFGDDGEPKGVAGMPTLKVLQGHDIVNAALITVRYFGGIKLGTGGMARAYADTANLAVSEAKLSEYIKPFQTSLAIAYNDLSRLEHMCGGYDDVSILERAYETDGIRVVLGGREASVIQVIAAFSNQ